MRGISVTVLMFALAACGGESEEANQLSGGTSELTPAQINAALGPEDQTNIVDVMPDNVAQNGTNSTGNAADTAAEENQ